MHITSQSCFIASGSCRPQKLGALYGGIGIHIAVMFGKLVYAISVDFDIN